MDVQQENVPNNQKQVVKVIWQKGRIAAAHGRFNGIRQLAPVCTPPNACFPGPTWVLNPNGISIGSAVFACTAHRWVSPYFTMCCPSPSKLPILMGDLDPHLIHGSLGPPESSTQTASQSLQPFSQGSLLQWQTDRQTDPLTDHAARYADSVTLRPHLRTLYCNAA